MSEHDEYLWDRSGEADAFVAGLERRLAPLGDEADALLDELELIDELEAGPSERSHADPNEAVVVALPARLASQGRSASAEPRARRADEQRPSAGEPRRWLWTSAAAALLLALSGLVLAGEPRQRLASDTVQVGGGVEPLAQIELELRSVQPSVAASKLAALTELRSLHRPLAACARARVWADRETLSTNLDLVLGDSGPRLLSATATRGELDEDLRACLTQAVSEWQPQALGAGELRVMLTIEAGRAAEQ